jgi:hypothetical protein
VRDGQTRSCPLKADIRASPTEPMDGRTPASWHRAPKASDVYWLDSNGRRNTLKEELR